MTLSFVFDMNLSPEWATLFASVGWESRHWSDIGDATADDESIMDWARVNGRVVVTNDLDFTTALALTNASGPSVIQLRGRQIYPDQIGKDLISAIVTYESELAAGAILTVDASRSRVRILPIGNN